MINKLQGRRVLLAQDEGHRPSGDRLFAKLEERGAEVDYVRGFDALGENHTTAGRANQFPSPTIRISYRDYSLAFMDNGLRPAQPSGAEVTRKLVANRVKVISISGSDAIVEAGGYSAGSEEYVVDHLDEVIETVLDSAGD